MRQCCLHRVRTDMHEDFDSVTHPEATVWPLQKNPKVLQPLFGHSIANA
jgi:hypothetical protein